MQQNPGANPVLGKEGVLHLKNSKMFSNYKNVTVNFKDFQEGRAACLRRPWIRP
jgi:hypothetical protein